MPMVIKRKGLTEFLSLQVKGQAHLPQFRVVKWQHKCSMKFKKKKLILISIQLYSFYLKMDKTILNYSYECIVNI